MQFLKNFATECTVCSKPTPCLSQQLLRYAGNKRRKPRYIPKSKSKVFYVRKPTYKDPEETEELLVRYRHYRTALKSIHSFLGSWQAKVDTKVDHVEHNVEAEEAEQERLMGVNEEWNRQTRLIREARQAEEDRASRARTREKETVAELKALMVEEEARKRVLEESSIPFIKAEDLDHEIEKVMATCTDFNFSIDTRGNVYPSRTKSGSSDTLGSPDIVGSPDILGSHETIETSSDVPGKGSTGS